MAYLAAATRQAGHDVSVADALGENVKKYTPIDGEEGLLRQGIDNAAVVELIEDKVEVIGVSCMFSQEWLFTRDLINRIRKKFPHATIVAGGEHITALPEYTLKDCPALDVCVLGEGEQTFVDLLEALTIGHELEEVNGLCIRHGDGFTRTTSRKRLRQIDDLPWPAWDLVPLESYLNEGVMPGVNLGRSMPLLASRGCPYKCTFCSNPGMWGTLWRSRDAEEVFREMRHYMKEYGATNFDFYDLTAIVNRKWIVDFCRIIIESGVEITWQLPSGTRSEVIDEEVTKLLYDSGCRFASYAPESGSPEILEKIKKKVTKPRMLDSMRYARSNGLSIKANMILGFPGETWFNVLETYHFILQMAWIGVIDISVFPFSPYPGSALFQQLHDKGKIKLGDPYFFSLLHYYTKPKEVSSYSENFTQTQLLYLRLIGMSLFYGVSFLLRPIRIWRLVRNVRRGMPGSKLENSLILILKKRQELKALNALNNQVAQAD